MMYLCTYVLSLLSYPQYILNFDDLPYLYVHIMSWTYNISSEETLTALPPLCMLTERISKAREGLKIKKKVVGRKQKMGVQYRNYVG